MSGTLNDITDHKAAEDKAELQRQEVAHLMRVSVLGGLSGAIAHEINQPLTAILANAQAALHMLAEDAPNVAEVRNALSDIVEEDNRAGLVIQRLRNLLKKGDTTNEPVEFNHLVNSTMALLNSELIARGIAVQTDLANDLPFTSGDPVQLQQVLINLIVNAADAMASTPAAQRQIAVSTGVTRQGTVEVLVRDRGTGLLAAEPGKLFEPFHTTKKHGLGLGLTICSTIVEAHGGKLSLTNRPGGGAEGALRAAGPGNAHRCPMSEKQFTVYIVDDDAGVLNALARLLRVKGYNVQAFNSPLEFLAKRDATVPACVVLDITMPGLDGLHLQQELTSDASLHPVIFLTGTGDIPTSVRAMQAGALDFLTKPVSADNLVRAIARAQEQNAKAREARAELTMIQAKMATLTQREIEVLGHVIAGRLNKQIAHDLGTAEKTIKVHRSRMMHKLGLSSVTDLVRLAEKVGIRPPANKA